MPTIYSLLLLGLIAGLGYHPRATATDLLEAQKPTPFVGYTMRFTGRVMGLDCLEWRLSEIKDNGDVISSCGDYRLELSGKNDLNARKVVDGNGKVIVEIKPFAPALKFPLAIGTRWRAPYVAYTGYNGLIWEGESDCETKAYEKITVQAGTFNAFRIECRDKWQASAMTGYTHSTRWYAPEAAGVVKSEQREDPARWNFELVSYGLAENAGETAPAVTAPAPAAPTASESGMPPILDPEDY
jgi:hypothetical protein